MQKIPLTLRGAELLKEELQYLKSVARPAVIEAIAEARSHGDLSENAEYEAAKEKQVGGSADTKASSFDSVKSWNDLMKLHSKDINRYAKENPKKFTELKKRHFNK